MKELYTILSFLLIFSESYSYNSDTFKNFIKNSCNISELYIMDSLRSNKTSREKPCKALKKGPSFNYRTDSLKYLKDTSSVSEINNTIRSDSACSALFRYHPEKEYFKKNTMSGCILTMVSGKIYYDVRLSGLNDSTVKILKNRTAKTVYIKDIRTVKIKGRGFWKGALLGGGSALLLGLIAGHIDTTSEYFWDGMKVGIGLILPLAIIGGIFESKNTVYDLSEMDIREKKKSLRYLFSKY